MALGSLAGHARVSTIAPEGMVECDRCREWLNRSQVTWQYYWRGPALANSGLLVCRRKCLDEPNEQFRTLILPGDPRPFQNPRVSPNITAPRWLDALVDPATQTSPAATPGNFGFVGYPLGSIDDLTYPTTKLATLNALSAANGVSTPFTIVDKSIVFTSASVSQSVMGANSSRTWLAAYSPAQPYAVISTTTAILGATGTVLPIGPSQAWFQALALGNGAAYQGALTAAGLTAGMNLFAWEAPGADADLGLYNNGGMIGIDAVGAPYFPTSSAGLSPGAFYSNGGELSVVPGYTVTALAVPLTWPISAFYLATFGGGTSLAAVGGTPGDNTLWSNGGAVAIS